VKIGQILVDDVFRPWRVVASQEGQYWVECIEVFPLTPYSKPAPVLLKELEVDGPLDELRLATIQRLIGEIGQGVRTDLTVNIGVGTSEIETHYYLELGAERLVSNPTKLVLLLRLTRLVDLLEERV
jgi:hypothetical protein